MSVKNSRWALLTAGIFLVGITWAVFGQTIGHQFVNYDDPLYVLENSHVRAGLNWHGVIWAFTHVHSQNWHPLTTISHMLDCQLFGLQPGWHHFVNVLLHSVGALLLFLLLERMTGNIWASAFVASVFAIHPQHVESVAWIAERKDVLSGVFFMLTLTSYGWFARRPSVGRYITTSILFACGLMSKPMLVTVPIVLLLLDYWPLNRFAKLTTAKLIVEKIPLFALSIGSCIATLWAQNFALGSTEYLPLKWRITNAMVAYFEYIRQMFWPVDLVPFYIHPENRLEIWRLLLAATTLIAVTAIAFARRRKNPYLVVGWFWYLVMLAPVIGLIQVGLQGRADRYIYLPQIGLYIAIVWLVRDLTKGWRQQKIILATAAAIVVGGLSILSWKQTTHWRDTETLWSYTLSVTPDSDVAHAGLAGILFVRGHVDEAVRHYENALRLRSGNVAAQFGLARALASKQKTDEAISHYQKALSIQPDNIAASNDLGVLFASKGEIANAIAAWRQTLSFDPDNSDAANDLAWVLATSADAELRNGGEAVELAQRAIRSGGENPFVLRTLAAALAETNQFSEAAATAERGTNLAQAGGDHAMAESLRHCEELFRRGEKLHSTQIAH
ncbi:MAG TPA: tetratricopeptide repeat protein [Chthoniobacterales bacterium]|nr:tetratricopeptide repeat protein [Chthoniobacterales bacterium]